MSETSMSKASAPSARRPMTPYRRRGRQAILAALIGLSLTIAGAGAVWLDTSRATPPDIAGPVVENWQALTSEVSQIEIMTADDQFTLTRTEAGWVMPSRGGFSVRPERIAALDAALGALQFDRAMTRDREKFDRLGLGDPNDNGRGVRLTVRGGEGQALADLVVGATTPDGAGTYIRQAGGARAYAVRGTLPELADPGVWLGLSFWDIDPSAVARADITPEQGPAWRVERAGIAQRNHELRAPQGWRFITGGAANGVAAAGGRLRFRDVKPQSALTGAFSASHAGQTFSGLAYRFDFVTEGDERWARIDVIALADDAEPRAQRLQGLVEGWAFKVSEDAYERLTRSLDQVAEPVEPITGAGLNPGN